MLEIKHAKIEDALGIAALLNELGYPETDSFILQRLAQLLVDPNAVVLVSKEATQVLAMIALHFIPQLAFDGNFCRISYFCVGASARGRGLGARLEQQAVAIAKSRGCVRIELHCHQRRIDAHHFYDRQGYAESPKYLFKDL